MLYYIISILLLKFVKEVGFGFMGALKQGCQYSKFADVAVVQLKPCIHLEDSDNNLDHIKLLRVEGSSWKSSMLTGALYIVTFNACIVTLEYA